MKELQVFFQSLYRNFNERKIYAVLSHVSDDLHWANGMEGGHVEGRDAVRDYWTRQFSMVSAQVTPEEIAMENETVKIKVHQVIHDMDGKLLADEWVDHYFHLTAGLISRFDISGKMGAVK